MEAVEEQAHVRDGAGHCVTAGSKSQKACPNRGRHGGDDDDELAAGVDEHADDDCEEEADDCDRRVGLEHHDTYQNHSRDAANFGEAADGGVPSFQHFHTVSHHFPLHKELVEEPHCSWEGHVEA